MKSWTFFPTPEAGIEGGGEVWLYHRSSLDPSLAISEAPGKNVTETKVVVDEGHYVSFGYMDFKRIECILDKL